MQIKEQSLNLLGLAMRAGKIISGSEIVIANLTKGKVKVVILANDLHKNSLEKVTRVANKANVKIISDFSATELAHAIGKSRKVLGLTDSGFAKALVKKINEGV